MATSEGAPETVRAFVQELKALRSRRREEKRASPQRAPSSLSQAQRLAVFEKTNGRCHVCGGEIGEGPWHADHVLAHSRAGQQSFDNYLPAHPLCNNYRWDYQPEEFQLILKLGVWARTQIERETGRGEIIAEGFLAHERRRAKRSTGR